MLPFIGTDTFIRSACATGDAAKARTFFAENATVCDSAATRIGTDTTLSHDANVAIESSNNITVIVLTTIRAETEREPRHQCTTLLQLL